MADNRALLARIVALEAIISNQNSRITALDAAIASVQSAVIPPTPPDIAGAVSTKWDSFVAASGDFFNGHCHRAMEIPIGIQDGAHTTYFCPSGEWSPGSITAFINGRALPKQFVTQRSNSSIKIGGGLPIELWPDLTIANRKELRVSYDLYVADPSGDLTPSGFMTIYKSDIDFDALFTSKTRFGVEISEAGTLVNADTPFNWPDDIANFAYDNQVRAWLNGVMVQKEVAGPWTPGSIYGSGDRTYYSSDFYQCNTLHYASGTWAPTAAYWDPVVGKDFVWLDASGAMMTFDIGPGEFLHVEVPKYT